jgi:2-methylcitrate dehydratase PrpD
LASLRNNTGRGVYGPCTLFGTNHKTSALDATFFNGTASHAPDYDDFSQPMGGHQSTGRSGADQGV